MDVRETKRAIKYLPWEHSIMLTGAHGLGKSAMWWQAALELSIETGIPFELIDIRLSEREPGDVIGYPYRVDSMPAVRRVFKNGVLVEENVVAKNVMAHSLPIWFPTDPDWHGFLLMDEIDRATREVQQSSMELSLDHTLNRVPLPKHCRVGSCCNGAPDIYTTLIPCPAFISRYAMIPFKPLVSEWHTNFDAIVGHRAIKLYITKFPGDLDVPEGILAPYTAYTNRRSWVKLSEALLSFEAAGQDLLDFKGDTTNDQPAESFLTKLAAS